MVTSNETLATRNSQLATEKKAAPFFSVIIPVYNVAPYLRECLDSILAQSFTDWECLCVNDGSTDESGAILDEYAAKDTRFRVFHQENRGVSAARNQALACVCGEFICFADGDDIAYPWWLETFYTLQQKTGADLVRTKFPGHRPYKATPPNLRQLCAIEYHGRKDVLEWGWTTLSSDGYPFIYALRRTCLGAARFLTGVRKKEDILFGLSFLPNLNRCVQCNIITYWYRYRANSAIRRKEAFAEVAYRIHQHSELYHAQKVLAQTVSADLTKAMSWLIFREIACIVMEGEREKLCKLVIACRENGILHYDKLPRTIQYPLRKCEKKIYWLFWLRIYLSHCKWALWRWCEALSFKVLKVER